MGNMKNNLLAERLLEATGHELQVVVYEDPEGPCVSLENVDTNEVILDSEVYDLTEADPVVPYDTLLHAFLAYVENDAETAELSYVRETLEDVCGLTPGQLEEIGLGWTKEEEEDGTFSLPDEEGRFRLRADTYMNGNLYVGIERSDGLPWCGLTTNFEEKLPPLKNRCVLAYLDVNNCPGEYIDALERLKLFRRLPISRPSGWVDYPLVEIDMEVLNTYLADETGEQ